MSINLFIQTRGGICYAHGPYDSDYCPSWPKCESDTKHVEHMIASGLNDEQVAEILGLECYCVCHSDLSSCAYCNHCLGNNPVGNYHKQLAEYRTAVLEEAKSYFNSDRTNNKPLIEAVGNLLIHEYDTKIG